MSKATKNSWKYQEEYSIICGRYPNNQVGAISVKINDQEMVCRLDMSKPVTLNRMKELVIKLKEATRIDFDYIRVNHVVFGYDVDMAPDEIKAYVAAGDYVPYTTLVDKTYEYDAKTNTLLIRNGGEPVYENSDGTITDDPVALADTYM